MPSLYETLLPLIQAINEEGGNFSAFHLSKPVLDAIDIGGETDQDLGRIRGKISEKIAACNGKRDHAGFSQIFEAYTEGVIYLVVTRKKGMRISALPDGGKHGKTPDFATTTDLPIGLEVKTINVFDPVRTLDRAMDLGFEVSYAARERSLAEAAKSGRGIGFAEITFSPHGEGADPKDAVEQTIKKVRGNVKAGQYEARPTLLVLSLVRLGVHQNSCHLRQYLDIDEDCDVAPSGHLFAIAANRLENPYFDYSSRYYGVRDLGPLSEAGVLRDHSGIAGIVFLETIWHCSDDQNVIQTGFRFNGVWNTDWDSGDRFTREQKTEAKNVFLQLCDSWNDTENARAHLLPGQ